MAGWCSSRRSATCPLVPACSELSLVARGQQLALARTARPLALFSLALFSLALFARRVLPALLLMTLPARELPLRAEPVVEILSFLAPARQVELVGALRDPVPIECRGSRISRRLRRPALSRDRGFLFASLLFCHG